ncbi:hypothetical protein [Bartonella sp. CL48QHWL]
MRPSSVNLGPGRHPHFELLRHHTSKLPSAVWPISRARIPMVPLQAAFD